jgi:hypothetical protein
MWIFLGGRPAGHSAENCKVITRGLVSSDVGSGEEVLVEFLESLRGGEVGKGNHVLCLSVFFLSFSWFVSSSLLLRERSWSDACENKNKMPPPIDCRVSHCKWSRERERERKKERNRK